MRHVGFDEFLTLGSEALLLVKRHRMRLRMKHKLPVAFLPCMLEQGSQHLLAYALPAQ